MTDYERMAQECRDELDIIEMDLERARQLHDVRAVAILEDIRMELRVKEREFWRRAGMQPEKESQKVR